MQTHTWKTLIVGVCCAFGALSGTPGRVAADEIGELRQQLAEQRRVMELMEQRLLELEAKSRREAKKRSSTAIANPRRCAATAWRPAMCTTALLRPQQRQQLFAQRQRLRPEPLHVSGPRTGPQPQQFRRGPGPSGLSGTVFDPKVSYFFQFEGTTFGNSNRQTMLDWWMQYSFSDYAKVQAGRFILPYSRQFYTHPGICCSPTCPRPTMPLTSSARLGPI